MTTTALTQRSERAVGRRIVVGFIGLLVTLVVSSLLLAYNYWVGISFLFLGLLLLVGLIVKEYEARNLFLLLILSSFVAVLAGSLAQIYLLTNSGINEQVQSSGLAIFITSSLIGVIAALVIIIIPFLLLVAIAMVGILKWHQKDEKVSFLEAYWHLLTAVLGIFSFAVVIEKGEKKGSERDIARLEHFGGPGWLLIQPGQVVVLQAWGKITRVVDLGRTRLERDEQIKAILPLTPQGKVNDIENVLTQDRVPVTLKVFHLVQMEPAAATKERLDVIEDGDYIVGDEYDQCYASIAKTASTKAPDVWESMKNAIAGNIKDVFMTCTFDELFNVSAGSGDLADSIDRRKIAEIEKVVREKVEGSGPGKGVALKAIDINEIHFHEEISDKINKEVTALMDARIKETEARAKEITAISEAKVMQTEATAKSTARATEAKGEQTAAGIEAETLISMARARAQALDVESEGLARARAESYRLLIQALKQEDLPADTIKSVLQTLTASHSTFHYIQGEHTTTSNTS